MKLTDMAEWHRVRTMVPDQGEKQQSKSSIWRPHDVDSPGRYEDNSSICISLPTRVSTHSTPITVDGE